MDIFKEQNEKANDILRNYRGKVLAIVKATRAGATFSLLKRACELKQKTVIVAPYIEIFNKTVNEVGDSLPSIEPRIARISKNEEICVKVGKRIEENPNLKNLAFHLRPSCTNCEYNDPDLCNMQRILAREWDILGLTYAKLRILCMSTSRNNLVLLRKIKATDNLILDEFVTGIITTSPTVPVKNPSSYIDNEADLFSGKLDGPISDAEFRLREKTWDFAFFAQAFGEKIQEGKYELFKNPLSEDDRSCFRNEFVECWKVVAKLTADEKNTALLQKLLSIISAENFMIRKKDNAVSITPIENLEDRAFRGSAYLNKFVTEYTGTNKLVALVDACLPDLDLADMLGIPVEKYFWGDPLNTNKYQLVICDTSKIGLFEFFRDVKCKKKLMQLIELACRIHKRPSILVVTLNKRMAAQVLEWEKTGQIPKVDVTYYRSEFSRGIVIDLRHRILILIGAPYLPKVAYLAETYNTDKLAAFRKSDVKSAFINLIGRVKDPKGIRKSVVYAAGITGREIRAFVKQEGIVSPLISEFLVTGADALDFEIVGNSFLHADELTQKWNDLEKDLPVLARILRACRLKDRSLTLSEILPDNVERIQQFVESCPEVLKGFKIDIVKKPRGYRLVPLKS